VERGAPFHGNGFARLALLGITAELTLGAVDLDSIGKKYTAVHIGKSDEKCMIGRVTVDLC
jgi:hypothetical protein